MVTTVDKTLKPLIYSPRYLAEALLPQDNSKRLEHRYSHQTRWHDFGSKVSANHASLEDSGDGDTAAAGYELSLQRKTNRCARKLLASQFSSCQRRHLRRSNLLKAVNKKEMRRRRILNSGYCRNTQYPVTVHGTAMDSHLE